MKRGMIIIASALALLTALLIGGSLVAQVSTPSGLSYARESAEIERLHRQSAQAEALAPLDLAVAAAWRVVPLVALLGGLLYLASLGVAHLTRFRRERQPDERGLLPVNVYQLDDMAPQALGAYHAARQLEAGRQLVPHTLTYSPASHYAPRVDYRADAGGAALLPADVAAPELPALPGVTDLASLAFQPSREAILLGLGEGGSPITVPMRSLWHIAMAGPTGNGKSNIARMVVAQLQAIGAQVCIGDPKWTEYDADQDEDWRPIAARLYREPAHDAKGIGVLLKWAGSELARRLDLRRQGQKSGDPLFIYLDELPWIAAHVPNAEGMIGDLVRVGRGVGLFLLVGAQDMLAKTINLSAERDNFRTGFYLGGDDTTGAILLGIPKREVRDPDGMGMAWLRSSATTPPQQVRVPYASNRAIYTLLSPTSPPTSQPGVDRAAEVGMSAREVGGEARASGIVTPSARDHHILSLVRQRKGITDIVAEVWGVRGGSRFSEYSAEVMRVISEAI